MKEFKIIRSIAFYVIIVVISFTMYSFVNLPSAKYQMMNSVVIKRLDDGALYLKGCINLKFKNQISSFGKSTFGIEKLDKSLAYFEPAEVKQIFPADKLKKNLIGDNELVKIFSLKYNYNIDPGELSKKLIDENKDIVEWIEPDYVYEADFTPNDPSVGIQWFLNKISAYTAWDISQGDTTVLIGMVDTGSDLDHPDLAANIKINWAENPTNGIDDDNNGYTDDWRGWDFAGAHYQTLSEDSDPNIYGSNCDHGSHTSGCASEIANNSLGGAGIGFKCKLLICKHGADDDYTGSGGTSYLYHTDYGIMYAYQNGAKVINCSFGGTNSSGFTQTIINAAWANGTIVVASAGNDGINVARYPASYTNVISVAATNSSDIKASWSNYHSTVDICAPGTSIYSTLWNNTYTYYEGTSMSSPIVAGTVALIWSKFPSYTATEVVNKLLAGVDNIYNVNPSYQGLLGSGRVNAYKCVLTTTGISNYNSIVPANYAVSQNYPNPFNPTTNINFDLPKGNNVKLKVYDMSGKEVAVLLNEYKSAGKYTYTFDANSLSSGVYFYRISAGDFSDTRKMMLVK